MYLDDTVLGWQAVSIRTYVTSSLLKRQPVFIFIPTPFPVTDRSSYSVSLNTRMTTTIFWTLNIYSLLIVAALILILLILLFLLLGLLILHLPHEVVHFLLATLKDFAHFRLRYRRISCIHLQLSEHLADVILAEEERSYIQVRPELIQTVFGFSKLLRRLGLHRCRLITLRLIGGSIVRTARLIRCTVSLSSWGWVHRCISLSLDLLHSTTHFFGFAFMCRLIALFHQAACIIFLTNWNLGTVYTVLAVHGIGAIESSGLGGHQKLLRLVHIRLNSCRSAQTLHHFVQFHWHLLPPIVFLLTVLDDLLF